MYLRILTKTKFQELHFKGRSTHALQNRWISPFYIAVGHLDSAKIQFWLVARQK